jgi:hypothetical protein
VDGLFRVAHNLTMDLFRAGKHYISESADADNSATLEIADTSLSPEEVVIKREELRRPKRRLSAPLHEISTMNRQCWLGRQAISLVEHDELNFGHATAFAGGKRRISPSPR